MVSNIQEQAGLRLSALRETGLLSGTAGVALINNNICAFDLSVTARDFNLERSVLW